ncbi:MAG TPA: primosomal protein N', partial [Fimbriimonas sp.]
MSTAWVADVAIDPRSGGSEAVYTYRASGGVVAGDAVFVSLAGRPVMGFVTQVYEASEADLGFGLDALKPLEMKVEGLRMPEAVVELARHVAEEYLCPLAVALSPASPPGVRERLSTTWTLAEREKEFSLTSPTEHPLTPLQQEVLRVVSEKKDGLSEGAGKKIPANYQRVLRALKARGLVEERLRVLPFAERRKIEPLLRLNADGERVEAFLKKEGKKKPAQALVLMRLQGSERGALTLAEIKALAGVTETTVKALIDAELLVPVEWNAPSLTKPPAPNDAQTLAIEAIADAVESQEHRGFLLYGVTGSGKTEVYLRAAAEALTLGRQVLYLVPEIALAAQVIAQLRERFGKTVAVLHSDLPAKERLQNWMRIRDGEACVVAGARSALFAPLNDLGLVIVDEEHEAAYKQEQAPRYHARSLAMFLGKRHRCPVVLGSATPSLESFYLADQERLSLLSLPARAVSSAKLPQVFVDDLTEGYRFGKPSILAQDLFDRIHATLEQNRQVILFLNRRAYAPFLICRDCGHQMKCPNCAVSLSYHRRDHRLRCHHCGFHQAPPDACPQCGGLRLNPFGVGTEKVEEAVKGFFPDAAVARLDRDVARRRGVLEDTLAGFRSGDIQMLVGTQMVAKGLDFPNVTLVGVIAADVSLNIPDFRSSERTFQLLSQVAGRAGRGDAPGDVVIQTFNPEHVAVRSAAAHDYLGLY